MKAAFEYYLSNFNNGRPFVIASHSQGSYHAERLIKEYVDGKTLQNKLIAAYLIGRPIPPDAFKNIRATEKTGWTLVCGLRGIPFQEIIFRVTMIRTLEEQCAPIHYFGIQAIPLLRKN